MTYTPVRLARAEDTNGDPDVFGVVLFLPYRNVTKSAAERLGSAEYIDPNNAKHYAIKIVESLLAAKDDANIRDTNWTSVVAGIQKMMIDWNRDKRDRLGASAQPNQVI